MEPSNLTSRFTNRKVVVAVTATFLLCWIALMGFYFGNKMFIEKQKRDLIEACGLPNISVITSGLPPGARHTDVPWSVGIIGDKPYAFRPNTETGNIDYMTSVSGMHGLTDTTTGKVTPSNPIAFKYFASGPEGLIALKAITNGELGLANFEAWFVVAGLLGLVLIALVKQESQNIVEEETKQEEAKPKEALAEELETKEENLQTEAKRLKKRTKVLEKTIDEKVTSSG